MTSKRPNLDLSVEQITSKTAKEWLEYNTFNRRISEALVSTYAEAMINDEWVLNGEPIIFDREGRLQSGQHRLMAVIESGKSIWSVVVRGAEPDFIYSLDSGRKRRLADALVLRGEINVAHLSSCLTWTWRYEHQAMDRLSFTPSTTHLLQILDERSALREAVRAGSRVSNSIGVTAGLYAALYHQFTLINAEEADEFTEMLMTGANLPPDSPIFALRRWLIRAKMSDRRPPTHVYGAVTIKAWNAWREHAPLRAVRWAANEAFPEII